MPRRTAIMIALAVASGSAAAQASPAPKCEKEPGYIAGPFVPDEATARAIYVAVEATKGSQEHKAKYPIITVVDEGNHWGVFRTRPVPTKRLPNGDIAVVKEDGGGMLELEIDKCNGAMRASFSR
jgi:hypothetical protein